MFSERLCESTKVHFQQSEMGLCSKFPEISQTLENMNQN